LDNRARSELRSGGEASAGGRIETTPEELAASEVIRRLLGPSRPVAYEDSIWPFKIHLAERYTWVMCRLCLGRKRPSVWVPLPQDQVQALTPVLMLSTPRDGWTCVTLSVSGEIDRLGDRLRAAWNSQKAVRTRKPETAEVESSGPEGNGGTAEPEPVIATLASSPGVTPPDPFLG
jgi:hypothetical protein